MGVHDVVPDLSAEGTRRFTKAVLHDLHALEELLARGMIECCPRRLGAEQELFLIGDTGRVAPVATEGLARLDDDRFTTELARFNLEMNLPPVELAGSCFRELEDTLAAMLQQVRDAARLEGARPVMTGILPSLGKSDLSLDNITPFARYRALNDATGRLRGGAPYTLRLEGADSLHIEHDSVMLEACNTSFQIHLQVGHEEFGPVYNAAQALAGPVLASAANSPLLFGRRLWRETRIALFQQSIDTRRATPHLRELTPRVRFGDRWVERSVLELFQEDVARFPVLLTRPVSEDAMAKLEAGEPPLLQALQLHNSTVYSWNRPCYGVLDGKPHLRIECRYLAAGPSIADEVANAAFWCGVVLGLLDEVGDVSDRMEFDDARANFVAAARYGLKTGFTWLDGATVSASDLILDTLLPMAAEGLRDVGIAESEIQARLGVVEARVASGRTGANWLVESFGRLKDAGSMAERLTALTMVTADRQAEGLPVHQWPPAELGGSHGWEGAHARVEQVMTTELFTVTEDELVDRVAFMMDRKQLRQVLIEDTEHNLVGIVSYRSIVRLLAQGGLTPTEALPVRSVMSVDPVSVTPETPSVDAIELMRKHRVSALPVIKDGKLVGLVSEQSFMAVAQDLLRQKLEGRD